MNNILKTILIFILILALLTGCVYLILYNFSFKYDTTDPLIVSLIERSEQLDDRDVINKFNQSVNLLTEALNPSLGSKTETYNKITHNEFTLNYLKKLIIDNPEFKFSGDIFADEYTNLYNEKINIFNNKSFFKFKTKNDVSFAIKYLSNGCKAYVGEKYLPNKCSLVYLDINGKKGPNKLGVDLFDIAIYHAINAKWAKQNIPLIGPGRTFMHEEFVEQCIKGQGFGCSHFLFDGAPRNYLNKTVKKSRYKITDYYNHIYITPKGKVVFFNKHGFAGFVSFDEWKHNFKRFVQYKKTPYEYRLRNFVYKNITSKFPKKQKQTEKRILKGVWNFDVFNGVLVIEWY